jgi:hypothetical protein
MDRTPEQKAKQAAAQARFRAKQKALGIKRVLTGRERERQRAYAAERRAKARETGETLPSDSWWRNNIEKHRARGQRWRDENPERSAELTRIDQRRRRSTPWGMINNRIWPLLHSGVRRNSKGMASKYCVAFGYAWADLRAHLEAQFTPAMTWENWGDVWELDHIKPLSSFKYTSLDDPLFRECWALSNLRPLPRQENASKGAKHA